MRNKSRKLTATIIGLSLLSFFMGGYVAQIIFEPKVVTEVRYVEKPVTVYETVETVVEKVVEKVVEVEVVKEIPMMGKEFESLEALTQFLEIDDTESHVLLYPIEGSDGRIPLDGTCDYYALQLQRLALEAGHLMSTEIVNKNHMINCAVIGNEIYFIEPQTDEVWLWGHREAR